MQLVVEMVGVAMIRSCFVDMWRVERDKQRCPLDALDALGHRIKIT